MKKIYLALRFPAVLLEGVFNLQFPAVPAERFFNDREMVLLCGS